MDKTNILNTYISYVLDNGKNPESIYSFSKILGMTESDFYTYFTSFEAMERAFWLQLFEQTLEKLQSDKTYSQYGAKEKLLTFYFIWIAYLRENRSFVNRFYDKRIKAIPLNASCLDSFKEAFLQYADTLVKQGLDSTEIKERMYLTDKYKYGLWLQTMFVLNYWLNDASPNFEMTDAAIEKAVSLSFKLIQDNALDNVIDFGKFLFQKAV